MLGSELLDEIKNKITKENGSKSISDSRLALELGLSTAMVAKLRRSDLTVKQVVSLLEKYAWAAESRLIADAITPIAEFFFLDPASTRTGKSWRLFDPSNENGDRAFLSGLKDRLHESYGIYIFYDSRGRAIYAGKAQRQSLWTEMNHAFNRDRKEVQSIKIADHPWSRAYKTESEIGRKIVKRTVAIADLASYFSAYEVHDGLISKFEATIVRAFANDLLNVRMETF